MISFLIKKFLICLLSLFIVITLTFIIMKSIPGNPFLQEQELPEEILKGLWQHYGLDQPLHIQYFKYLKGFLTLDLGPSLIYQGRSVTQIIADGFPVSALIGLEALFISLFLGFLFGSLGALYKNKSVFIEKTTSLVSVIGISVPNFLMATLLQYLLAIKLNLLPIARFDSFAHTILPALSLSLLPTAFITRLLKNGLIEVLSSDYIKLAYAKGLNQFQVLWRHALKNALLPVIAYLGPLVTHILTGSFVIEKIFGLPGLGSWLITSISNRDYPLIMGLTVFFSLLLLSTVFLADLLSVFIDPRIKLFKENKEAYKKTYETI